jgi:hypothetical protein
MLGFGAEPQKAFQQKLKKEIESFRNLQRYDLRGHVGLALWRPFIMRIVASRPLEILRKMGEIRLIL